MTTFNLFRPLYFSGDVKLVDKRTLANRKISEIELVSEAAKALSECVCKHASMEKINLSQRPLVFLLGKGNNAADALGLALELIGQSKEFQSNMSLLNFFEEDAGSDAYRDFLSCAKGVGLKFYNPKNFSYPDHAIIIDAVFGSSFKGKLPSEIADEFRKINQLKNSSAIEVWAVDVASGLDADLCQTDPDCLLVDKTFNMGLAKLASHLPSLRKFTGAVEHVELQLDLSEIEAAARLCDDSWIRANLPFPKSSQAHKYTHGKLAIEAGSKKFPGAAQLCARAAFRAGCGYVSLRSEVFDQTLAEFPELVHASSDFCEDAFLLGPGLQLAANPDHWLKILKDGKKIIWDAGAFSFIKKQLEVLDGTIWKNSLVTPHEGEFQKLFDLPKAESFKEKLIQLKMISKKHPSLCLLLKGSGTLIAKNSQVVLIPTGNEALASAGQGDALAGFIGALLARGLDPVTAAMLGAYIQGYSAERLVEGRATQGLLAHEVADAWPLSLELLRSV